MTERSPAFRIVYADGPAGPSIAPDIALSAAGLAGPFEVILGWTPHLLPWHDDPAISGTTFFPGGVLRSAVAAGRLNPLAVRLGAVATRLREHPPDLAVVAGVRRGKGFAFSRAVGWADVAASVAGAVVVEVDESGTDLGGPTIDGRIVGVVPRPPHSPLLPPAPDPDEVDLAIGRHVGSLLPDGVTLEFGLGKVAAGVLAALDRPVNIWTGLLDEGIPVLHERGLLAGPAIASYTWGGDSIDRLHESGMLELVSATTTHDIGVISQIPRFVACNGAAQVALDGSVNVERVDGRTIAGIGGHADFSAGATLSNGGLSVVALRSTTKRGDSTIVPSVERVSTQRSDVGVVVTEHGVADLRDASEMERALMLASIAAPEHRDALSSSTAET